MGQRNDSPVHIPLEHPYVAPEEVTRRARTFCEQIRSRRTVRMFPLNELKMTPFAPAFWQRALRQVVPTSNLGTSLWLVHPT